MAFIHWNNLTILYSFYIYVILAHKLCVFQIEDIDYDIVLSLYYILSSHYHRIVNIFILRNKLL